MDPQVHRNPLSQNSKLFGIPKSPPNLCIPEKGQQGRREQHFLHKATPKLQELNPLVPFPQLLPFPSAVSRPGNSPRCQIITPAVGSEVILEGV